jgi:hypothetical protein
MMTDHDSVARLAPLARQWALEQEAFILKLGAPLDPKQIADAERVGVKDTARVRLLPVDRIPLPAQLELAEAARRAQIITDASAAVTLGHGIMVRADRWRDRELMLHQFVHIAQCERCGGLESFVDEYLTDRSTCADFTVGSLEDEARQLARDICMADGGA